MFLLDTYAWIEYFIGSAKGKTVEEILLDKECYTSILSLSEIVLWSLKNGKDPAEFLETVEKTSSVLNIDNAIAEMGGRLNFQHRKTIKDWGMIDSLIYSTALAYSLTVVTGDSHFTNLQSVKML
jgi:predicted nucleic acid-binding protein